MSFQAYLDTVEDRTGLTPRQLLEIAREKGFDAPQARAADVVAWFKEDYGLGRGHAMAMWHVIRNGLGAGRVMEHDGALAYGPPDQPIFWIGPLTVGDRNREVHLAFVAPSRAAVDAFRDAAVAQGAEVLHEPRVWPEYHESYYGAFVRDPDGNNVEAVCHGPA